MRKRWRTPGHTGLFVILVAKERLPIPATV
jgi:hypothetical protein